MSDRAVVWQGGGLPWVDRGRVGAIIGPVDSRMGRESHKIQGGRGKPGMAGVEGDG
jgi:hypothetical protein